MTDSENLILISNVLSINNGFADPYAGLWEHIWWRTDSKYAPVTFFVDCNDLFYWAYADSEKITAENFPLIKQAVDDVAAALNVCDPRYRYRSKEEAVGTVESMYDAWRVAGSHAADLFCARVRQMRPQRPCYKRYPDSLKPLFDACGPERDPKTDG